MNRSVQSGVWILPLVLLSAPTAWAGVVATAAGVTSENASWEVGDEAAPAQSAVTAFTEIADGSRWHGRIEIGRSRARASGIDLEKGAGAAFLVRWHPREAWALQAAVATPCGERRLNAQELDLARMVAEPLLAFPESDPTRGWRFHLGATWGLALSHSSALVFAGGADLAGRFEPIAGVTLDPPDGVSFSAALRAAQGRAEGQLRLATGCDGEERAAGVVVRERRAWAGGELRAGVRLAPVRLEAAAEWVAAGRTRVLHPDVYGAWVPVGVGSCGALRLTCETLRKASLGRGVTLGPSVHASWRRLLPRGLPWGDGWVAEAAAALTAARVPWALSVRIGRRTGSWRAWALDGAGPDQDLRGWMSRFELVWRGGESRDTIG